jgi:WD40 repeat protein
MGQRRLLLGACALVAWAAVRGPGPVCQGQEPKAVLKADGATWSLAFSPDGKTLGFVDWEGTIQLFETLTGKLRATLDADVMGADALAFSPDGRTLASGGVNRTIRLWDLPRCRPRAALRGSKGPISSLAFSPDGKTLASDDGEKAVHLWNIASGKIMATLRSHPALLKSTLTFSPDGKLLLVPGGQDSKLRLLDPVTRKERIVLRGHANMVVAVAFSPTGATLASASWDGTVRLWALATGKQVSTIRWSDAETRPCSLAFSPDGRTLAVSAMSVEIRVHPDGPREPVVASLWDVASRKRMACLKGHFGLIGCLAFTADGRTLASLGDEGTIRLWDVRAILKAKK